jgi:hypothetical protein
MYDDIPERVLQRAVHCMVGDPQRRWTCTNGAQLQIVAAGLVNPHEGPDFRDLAVLHDGLVIVGCGEFHRRASEWHAHAHDDDRRYQAVLVHFVLEDDVPVEGVRWTIVVDAETVGEGLRRWRSIESTPADVPVDELQHHALLRLLRSTAEASVHVRRLGAPVATRMMATAWIERLLRKRHRPMDAGRLGILRSRLDASAMGMLVRQIPIIEVAELQAAIERAERMRIAQEGTAIRRELFVNAVLPVLCAMAADDQRVVLFTWYWSARAVHPYRHLRRRFPSIPQDYMWQQQGMLEFLRHHGERLSVCADITRTYGVENTVRFLRAAEHG